MSNPPSWSNVYTQCNLNGSLGESNGKETSMADGYITSAQSKYGGGSYFKESAVSTGGITVLGSSGFAPGTGDYTIEAWVFPVSNTGNYHPIIERTGTPKCILFVLNAGNPPNIQVFLGDNGGGGYLTNIASAATVSYGVWSHIAQVRSSGNIVNYINGVPGAPIADTTNLQSGTGIIVIGNSYAAPTYLNGVRLCSEAVYTADFSASLPTSPFPDNPAFPAIQQRAPRSALVLPQINAAIARNL